MSRGAKITLIVFVILLVVSGIAVSAWFIFKNERAEAAKFYLNKGDSYLKEENYASALICYKKASLLTPRSYVPYFKQAILAKTTGHYEEARGFLNRSLGFGPREVVNYITLGEINLLNKNFGAAKTAFLEAKNIMPSSDEIDFLLVKTALQNNNPDEAEKYLLTAEKNNPLPKYKIYLALLKSIDDQTKALEMIVEIDGSVELGGLSLADFSNLFQKLAEMENLTSREVVVYQTFSQIGEPDFAVAGLEKISQDNPEMRDAWVFLGYGYLLINELDKAKNALNKAIEIDPVFPASYYLLSKYYEQKKDTNQAEKTLAKAKMLGFDENNPLRPVK